MALHARTAASVAVLVVVLASPLAVAARSRTVDAKPKRPHTAQHRVRPQAPSGGAARAARGEGQAKGGSQVAWDPNAVVRWEDQDGTVHYTHGYEVPQRFRPKVRHVYATVGTVPLDRAETGKSAAWLEGPPSIAALPVITLPPGPALPSAARTPQVVSQPPSPKPAR
jgi:Ni/Co efflux regulator RcnB